MSREEELRNRMIQSGVKAVRDFGYPECTAENILTDYLYAQCFKVQLQDVMQEPSLSRSPTIRGVAQGLLDEVMKIKAI
jgi:hypothetical protein